MRFEHEAAFIEQMIEHVQIMAGVPYLLNLAKEFGMEEAKEHMAKIDHFVKWFTKECEHDLIVPRGRHGYSYQDLRNDEALKWEKDKCVRCGADGFPYCTEHNPLQS